MDVSFSNVLEGTRQYFMGLPKPSGTGAGGGESATWPSQEEPAPAQSGAPTPSAPPPSAAAAPHPPRPPSEPLEPEPHIIHKATVMREAAEKRRERPEPDDDDDATAVLSPPSHVIRRPPPSVAEPAPPDPAPPTPARPPDHFVPARPPDPYSASRPPESYPRYYEAEPAARVPAPPRHGSPQTYARLSGATPPHAARIREPVAAAVTGSPPTPHNDRVPPIHHPTPPPRSPHYQQLAPHREPSPYNRPQHYDRHPPLPQRKYDPQQAYSGYRPAPTAPQPVAGHRVDLHPAVRFKHAPENAMQYQQRMSERTPVAAQPYPHHPHDPRHQHEAARRPDYSNVSRVPDARSSYHFPAPSTSSARYAPTATVAPAAVVAQSSTLPPRPVHRPAAAPKSNYEYPTSNHVQTSPARSSVKSGYPNQQARMTVSVTSLVNQMNQTKQKRESPLDLSVKTVKNSADSSTTQDDLVDSPNMENKIIPMQPRPTSSSRHSTVAPGYVESHKVDFAPDFTQYRERSANHTYPNIVAAPAPAAAPVAPHPVRYNGSYETPRPHNEPYPVESRHHVYPDRSKYSVPAARAEYVPRIDLTRPGVEDRRPDNRVRDDRHFIIEERKRPSGSIVSNIPEKIMRYETWSADSRIERMSHSAAREQQELMSQPVYSYSSHKQFEAYQNAQKRIASSSTYREQHPHINHRYPYPPEVMQRDRHDYHSNHHERSPSASSRHVIQKIPSHRDIHPHHLDPHSGVPADKRILSILRNSLETKQGFVEPARPPRQIPDLIVIDDVDDSVIEITDLTKEGDVETALKANPKPVVSNLGHHIQMPKAVDSIPSDYHRLDNSDSKSSPENDVASRIRTKAELKVMPPSDTSIRPESKPEEPMKPLPKSQKQHLFNQIREDQRLESVIKTDKFPVVKSEPMNIDEIEKDAIASVKLDNENLEHDITDLPHTPEPDDLDWASACDSFMEQLKIGAHKKKTQRKRIDTVELDIDTKNTKPVKVEPTDHTSEKTIEPSKTTDLPIVIKQEPLDEEEIKDIEPPALALPPQDITIPQNKTTTESSPVKEKTDALKDQLTPKKEDNIDEEKDVKLKTKSDSSIKKDIKRKKSVIETPEKSKKKLLLEGKQKLVNKAKKSLLLQDDKESEKNKTKKLPISQDSKECTRGRKKITSISQETTETDKEKPRNKKSIEKESLEKDKVKEKLAPKEEKKEKTFKKKLSRFSDKSAKLNEKDKEQFKVKTRSDKKDSSDLSEATIKKEAEDDTQQPINVIVKEEPESTDDDEPLINSKIMKEKEMRYQMMKDLSEKSAYVKLECFDVDLNKNTRISVDSLTKDKESKTKVTRQTSKSKETEIIKIEPQNDDDSTNTEDDDEDDSMATRLRVRKNTKNEDSKSNLTTAKTPTKSSPRKQDHSTASASSTPLRKSGFGDGSDFHPGWEEELYRYKRSLRMPTRLIAIPRGRSGGPHVRGSGASFTRGSTSLPDLDPAPLSPAPSSAPSAATDDLYARRQDKLTLDSDLESNSSYSATNRLQYDSEASTSTVFSTKAKKKGSSIVDVLIQKCGKREDSKRKLKDKDDKTPKVIPKTSNELLPTPSLGLVKNGNKGTLSVKKEKLMEDIFYLGAFRKETVTAFRNAFIKNTDGLLGATEEFAPVVLKTRTRTESRVMKQRATIKEVFGDERPASAPPTSGRDADEEQPESEDVPILQIKKEKESEPRPKLKPKKILKDKFRRSSSIRDGLRSTKSLKRNDAKGRLMRLKKRNSLMKSLASKRMKDINNKIKKEKPDDSLDENKTKDDSNLPGTVEGTKRRLKRLFGRRKFSSGFDYIRKKKKIIRREDTPNNKIRRPAVKPSPESESDIQKEIKGWFINKSVGETHLHRAARLGFTDCVAYCLEKMEADPSAKDNAGFTPLHVAAAKGHVRIARLLLQYGANVSAAANGGIRPLHEACENCHVEVIRLLLSYGADPLLGTYSGQTPEELTEGPASRLLRLHIADVQGQAIEPWRFPPITEIIDRDEMGNDPLSSPPPGSPPPPLDATIEMQCTEAPLPPFYSLKSGTGQPAEGLWCLLQDVTNFLQIKSKESLLKQIHCGSGSPKELLREIRTQEFLERAQCSQLLSAGEKVNVRASKVALVRVTDKLRQLLKIETVLIS